MFDALFKKADNQREDPPQSFLIFLKHMAERTGDLPNGHPGCLIASYVYSEQMFSRNLREMTTQGHRIWRRRFRERLDRIAARYPARIEIGLDDMPDMLSTVNDGTIILSNSLHEANVLPRQILQHRAFVRLVFLGN